MLTKYPENIRFMKVVYGKNENKSRMALFGWFSCQE